MLTLRNRIAKLETQAVGQNGRAEAVVTIERRDGTPIVQFGSLSNTARVVPVLRVVIDSEGHRASQQPLHDGGKSASPSHARARGAIARALP